jgi:hypothetical protein
MLIEYKRNDITKKRNNYPSLMGSVPKHQAKTV